MTPQGHTRLSPRIKMGLDIHTPARAVTLTNRPILLKGGSANNRRLIRTCSFENVVDGAVNGYGAFFGSARGWVVGAVAFDDVVFYEGGFGPAVD